MNWKKEIGILAVVIGVFAGCYFLPIDEIGLTGPLGEALHLVRWYARQHVLLCLVPAFFIAGGIATFISQSAVMKYLGAGANKVVAYGVASVSGSILAVCSCTVLPLFAGIYRMGAGIGPATAFLYAGPAINVLAMILTARVLGPQLGIARAIGAVVFSVVIGLSMHLLFRNDQREQLAVAAMADSAPTRPLWQTAAVFACMVGILIFGNWARTGQVKAALLCCPGGLSEFTMEGTLTERTDAGVRIVDTTGEEHFFEADRVRNIDTADSSPVNQALFRYRFVIAGVLAAIFVAMLAGWFARAELAEWSASSWGFAKQILPLLLLGVLVAGFLLGRPGREGIVPSRWVEAAVGGNSFQANLFASLAGAMMYFATLTEVPILKGLLGAGMGKGPALAMLLAGPALSLPNVLVIRSVIGGRKTLAYVLLVVTMATISGLIFGAVT